MTDARSVTSSVEVAVDPATAFAVFTEELDCWWIQGPINFYDSSRAYAKRVEPGVGGRIVEVYDLASGDGLELARITAWEPGARLAWTSSVDDVEIDVSFDAHAGGTLVRLRATIPPGGADRGGTSWVRMTPAWFGKWVARRDLVAHEPRHMARLALGIHYAKPATAARWLRDVFGLEPAGDIPEEDTDDDHTWIEFHVGTASLVVLARAPGDGPPAGVTHTPWVFVDDLDAHRARAVAGGAPDVGEVWQHGPRAYDVSDLEGHRWTFAQAAPLMR